jgi:hypothetical protein
LKLPDLYLLIIVTVLAFFVITSCSTVNKLNGPLKTYANIDIPDGELLHYGFYISSEKVFDTYQVTRNITNFNGGFITGFT